jgi:hypothetical protein
MTSSIIYYHVYSCLDLYSKAIPLEISPSSCWKQKISNRIKENVHALQPNLTLFDIETLNNNVNPNNFEKEK